MGANARGKPLRQRGMKTGCLGISREATCSPLHLNAANLRSVGRGLTALPTEARRGSAPPDGTQECAGFAVILSPSGGAKWIAPFLSLNTWDWLCRFRGEPANKSRHRTHFVVYLIQKYYEKSEDMSVKNSGHVKTRIRKSKASARSRKAVAIRVKVSRGAEKRSCHTVSDSHFMQHKSTAIHRGGRKSIRTNSAQASIRKRSGGGRPVPDFDNDDKI